MPTQHLKFDPARIADFELVVEVGDVYSEEGMTRARLDGYGRLTAEHHGDAKEKESPSQFQGMLDPETTQRLLRQASQFDWDKTFPSRKGIPDEAVVQWTLHDRQAGMLTLKAWLREAEKDAAMAPVLSEMRKGVQEATHGNLYL